MAILLKNYKLKIHIMEISDFIAHFAEQFENTDISVFNPETKFKELDEWSSLVSLCVIAMVDKYYHVRVKGDDIRESATIQELFNVVKSRS